MQKVIDSIQNMQSVRVNKWLSFCDCMFRGMKRKRRQKAVQRLRSLYMKQLDVRRLIFNSLTLQNFLNSFLTKPQKTLLTHHRNLVGIVASDTSQGATGTDEDPLANLPSPSFAKDLQGFKPVKMFDKNLVEGVLAGTKKHEAQQEPEIEQVSSASFDGQTEISMIGRTQEIGRQLQQNRRNLPLKDIFTKETTSIGNKKIQDGAMVAIEDF